MKQHRQTNKSPTILSTKALILSRKSSSSSSSYCVQGFKQQQQQQQHKKARNKISVARADKFSNQLESLG
jgi:hypothetical protein